MNKEDYATALRTAWLRDKGWPRAGAGNTVEAMEREWQESRVKQWLDGWTPDAAAIERAYREGFRDRAMAGPHIYADVTWQNSESRRLLDERVGQPVERPPDEVATYLDGSTEERWIKRDEVGGPYISETRTTAPQMVTVPRHVAIDIDVFLQWWLRMPGRVAELPPSEWADLVERLERAMPLVPDSIPEVNTHPPG